MDTGDKNVSWFGNMQEKFDTFCSNIDDVRNQDPFRYAEIQLSTAGANVKQFCSEFMQEMLPESIMNSLKEKIPSLEENQRSDRPACELLSKDANEGHIKGLVEDANIDPSLGTEANAEKEICFEENHVRQTTFPSEIPKVETYHDSEYNGHDDLPRSPSPCLPPKEGETSDPIPPKVRPSFVQQLANLTVAAGINENQFLEDQVVSSGHTIDRELVDLNDGSDDNKAEDTEDNYVAIAYKDSIQQFKTVKIEGKCKLCLVSDLPEDNPTSQGTVCDSCLTMKFEKERECEKVNISRPDDAESDNSGGKSVSASLLSRESESLDQDFCESDWVVV